MKINKSSIIELSEQDLSTIVAGTEIFSIGQICSCNNSCDRDNVSIHCCNPQKTKEE